MFSFFINDELKNFWSNKIGDIFSENTILKMGWNRTEVDLVYYAGVKKVPEFKEFGANKELRILKKIVTQNEEQSTNELGETVTNIVEVVSYELDQVIEPTTYMAKGIMVKPC